MWLLFSNLVTTLRLIKQFDQLVQNIEVCFFLSEIGFSELQEQEFRFSSV